MTGWTKGLPADTGWFWRRWRFEPGLCTSRSSAGGGGVAWGADARPLRNHANPWDEHTYKLVSLLEIMKLIGAHEPSQMTSALLFFAGMQKLGQGAVPQLVKKLRSYSDLCERLGLSISAKRLKVQCDILERSGINAFDGNDLGEIEKIIREELESTRFLHISTDRVALYESEKPFGDEVAAAFPSAMTDCEEAAKCLALHRGTASALHSMRVLEYGVKAFGLSSKIPFVFKPRGNTWGDVLGPIGERLKTINARLSVPPSHARKKKRQGLATIKRSQRFFSEAHAHLLAAKDAWRDPAMHVERGFTVEQAERVFVAVKSLMQFLAENIDENGKRV